MGWLRPPRRCPAWCGGGHLCTARHGYPAGEHRSEPITVRTGFGVMVCTRILSIAGRGRLEVRLQVDLSPDENVAYRQAAQVADEIKTAVQAGLIGAEASVACVDVDEPNLPALPRAGR